MTGLPAALRDLDWTALYEGLLDGFSAPRSERADIDARCGRGAATYGEIEPPSASRLLNWLAPRAEDHLFDLGSGTGRFLVQALCTTAIGRVVGVELCGHRHRIAMGARQRLLARLPDELAARTAARFELRHEDARSTDVGRATLVYLGATSFSDDLLGAIVRHIVIGAPHLRALAAARPLPRSAPRALVEIGRVDLAMSWSDHVGVHIYARRGRCNGATAPLQDSA